MHSILSIRTALFSLRHHRPPPAAPVLYRTYKKRRALFPKMPAVSLDEITARFAALSTKPEGKVIQHAAVKNGQEWRDALKEQGEVVLTKTVRPRPRGFTSTLY